MYPTSACTPRMTVKRKNNGCKCQAMIKCTCQQLILVKWGIFNYKAGFLYTAPDVSHSLFRSTPDQTAGEEWIASRVLCEFYGTRSVCEHNVRL